LGNHDKARLATRIGNAHIRIAALLLLTLRGTPTIYYGDELGMTNVPIAFDQIKDPWEKNVPGFGVGRDPARTPMPWDGSPHGGFTTGASWLPLSPDVASVNVATQREEPASILNLYRRLLALRRAEPALTRGTYRAGPRTDEVLLYSREWGARQLAVALNFSADNQRLTIPTLNGPGRLLLSTHLDREGEVVGTELRLRGHEGIILAHERTPI
jgi:alpha-glucosidase